MPCYLLVEGDVMKISVKFQQIWTW